MIKNLFLFLSLVLASETFAGTCTSITRSNYVSNTVLTSSALNADFNTVYSAANAFDGGCVTDGTLEDGALNTTDFELLLNSPKQGCYVTATDGNTLSVDRCRIAVGNNFVKTTTATTVTWLCSGCSAEASSTKYYLYARATSSGSTLNLLISTTAPNADGYDASNNRVLAKFYNNSISDIQTMSVTQWEVRGWENTVRPAESCTVTGTWSANTTYGCRVRRVGNLAHYQFIASTSGAPTSATLTFTLPDAAVIDTNYLTGTTGTTPITRLDGHVFVRDSGSSGYGGYPGFASSTTVTAFVQNTASTYAAGAAVTEAVPVTFGASDSVEAQIEVPIVGWD